MLWLAIAPWAAADPMTGPVDTDAFDVMRGAEVTAVAPPPTGVQWTAPATCEGNSFGICTDCGPEPGVGFWTDMGSTTEPSWVDVTLPHVLCLEGVRVFASHDTNAAQRNRSMRDFRVIADPDTAMEQELVGSTIAVPYSNQPGNVAAGNRELDLTLTGSEICTDQWRFVAQQNVEANSTFNGVRMVEIDAIAAPDADRDGVFEPDDCDDLDPDVNPSGIEVCNGIDDDCDGQIDEGVAFEVFPDVDTDGFGDATVLPQLVCTIPTGFVADGTDCDDDAIDVNPGATETCNDADDDCDGATDEGVTTDYFDDLDGDGYGDAAGLPLAACSAPAGMVDDASDCDDEAFDVNPVATEVCNTLDDDCDGVADDGVTTDYFADADGDGYGDATAVLSACSIPSGHVTDATDCDDLDPFVNPGATEVCDDADIDEDCNGFADDDDFAPQGELPTYADLDGDNFGDPNAPIWSCEPSTLVDVTDCDDSDAAINPIATELGDDGIDQNCDGDDGSYTYGNGCTTARPAPSLAAAVLRALVRRR